MKVYTSWPLNPGKSGGWVELTRDQFLREIHTLEADDASVELVVGYGDEHGRYIAHILGIPCPEKCSPPPFPGGTTLLVTYDGPGWGSPPRIPQGGVMRCYRITAA